MSEKNPIRIKCKVCGLLLPADSEWYKLMHCYGAIVDTVDWGTPKDGENVETAVCSLDCLAKWIMGIFKLPMTVLKNSL